MATQKPIGPLCLRFDELVSLVPRDLVEKLIAGDWEELDKKYGNTVLLTKSDAKQLEKEAKSDGAPKSLISQLKKLIKAAGKRMKDAPKLSAKEERQELKEATDEFCIILVTSWIQTMWVSRNKPQVVRLDDMLLPLNPDQRFFNVVGEGVNSWLEVVMMTTNRLITEEKQNEAVDVYKAFIANLKAEVDKRVNQKNLVFSMDNTHLLTLERDDQGYFLKIVAKPQTQ